MAAIVFCVDFTVQINELRTKLQNRWKCQEEAKHFVCM